MVKTSNVGLNVPTYKDLRWDVPVNQNWNTLDSLLRDDLRSGCVIEAHQDVILNWQRYISLVGGSTLWKANGDFVSISKTYNLTNPSKAVVIGDTVLSTDYFLSYSEAKDEVVFAEISRHGTSYSGGNTTCLFNNTSTGQVEYWDGNTQMTEYGDMTLPFARVRDLGNYKAEGLLEIYNGVGYIGGRVFMTPQTKVLRRNGLYEDGTARNVTQEISNLIWTTLTVAWTGKPVYFHLLYNHNLSFAGNYFKQDLPPKVAAGTLWECPIMNTSKYTTSTTAWMTGSTLIAKASYDGSQIINWEPSEVFQQASQQDLQNLKSELSQVSSVKAGTIILWGQNNPPEGYLKCDGAQVSRTDYADLFAEIGTTFGTGDGSTTFTLPNFVDKFPQGANGDTGTSVAAGLPNITGSITTSTSGKSLVPFGELVNTMSSNKSLWYTTGTCRSITASTTSRNDNVNGYYLDASKSSNLYGNSSTVQPSSVKVSYCIKY